MAEDAITEIRKIPGSHVLMMLKFILIAAFSAQ
jgi:hypothetical protein